MTPGRLRHRLTLQSNGRTRNEWGELIDSWVDVDTVYGEVKPLTAAQRMAAARNDAQITHLAYVRYRDNVAPLTLVDGGNMEFVGGGVIGLVSSGEIKPVLRVQYNSRTFDVLSSRDIKEGHKYNRMILREVAA